jgi:chaperonin GroES
MIRIVFSTLEIRVLNQAEPGPKVQQPALGLRPPQKAYSKLQYNGGKEMSFGIKPLGEKVVIKRLEAEEKTQSGIVLPGQAKEKPQIAEVVAVGPGTEDDKMELKVGDFVLFSQYAGTQVKYLGDEYTILSQKDVLATVDR